MIVHGLIIVCTLISFGHSFSLFPHYNKALKPSQDPWYIPPSNLEDASLGRILKYRNCPVNVQHTFVEARVKSCHQIMYSTSNSTYHPEAAVTTILVPQGADFEKLLSFQQPIDSACLDCVPSYALGRDKDLSMFSNRGQALLIETLLNKGWVVVTPDYNGIHGAQSAGVHAGQLVLDSIRAALRSNSITGVKEDARVALWGYGGGSFATGWAAELAPSYYNSLKLVGAALGGVVSDYLAMYRQVNEGPYSGMVYTGFKGLAKEFSSFATLIEEKLEPTKRKSWNRIADSCLADSALSYMFQDFGSCFSDGIEDHIFDDVQIKNIHAANSLGRSKADIPSTPLYFYQSADDSVAPVSATMNLYHSYCARGVSIEYKKNTASEHITEQFWGAPGALYWLGERLEGRKAAPGCSIEKVVTGPQNSIPLDFFGSTLYDSILDVLAVEVGPGVGLEPSYLSLEEI